MNKQRVQYHVTDWEFVINRAERNNKYITTDDGILTLQDFDFTKSANFTLGYGDNIIEIEVEIDSSASDIYTGAVIVVYLKLLVGEIVILY